MYISYWFKNIVFYTIYAQFLLKLVLSLGVQLMVLNDQFLIYFGDYCGDSGHLDHKEC